MLGGQSFWPLMCELREMLRRWQTALVSRSSQQTLFTTCLMPSSTIDRCVCVCVCVWHVCKHVISHLCIQELLAKKRREFEHIAVFPCKLRIMPNCIFNTRDPIVVGVIVEAGIVKPGTPLTVPSKSVSRIL